MRWFLNLATRTKLFLGFGLMIILLLGLIATAYQRVTQMNESQKRLYEDDLADVSDLKAVATNLNAIRADMLGMLLLAGRSDQEALHRQIQDRSQQIDDMIDGVLERNRGEPGNPGHGEHPAGQYAKRSQHETGRDRRAELARAGAEAARARGAIQSLEDGTSR